MRIIMQVAADSEVGREPNSEVLLCEHVQSRRVSVLEWHMLKCVHSTADIHQGAWKVSVSVSMSDKSISGLQWRLSDNMHISHCRQELRQGNCTVTIHGTAIPTVTVSAERRPQYLYWNQSCLNSCDPPLMQRFDGPAQFCDYSCSTTSFLYWNGTCLSQCASPLVQKIERSPLRQFCIYPCASVDEFLYWNTSCLSTCKPPFVTRIDYGKKYCDYPCAASQYLYYNGSCQSTCNVSIAVSDRQHWRNVLQLFLSSEPVSVLGWLM